MTIPVPVQNLLGANGINNGMPAWTIINNANLLPPLPGAALPFGDTVPAALRKLMASFYNYGRTQWTWAQTSPITAANGGLVKGLTAACACGSFNHNFKWLAETLCGIQGITPGQYVGQFLTMPGGVCIDSKWAGNVRSTRETFDQLKVFKFRDHYWVQHGGVNYDVCYNNTFASANDVVWTPLLNADPNLVARSGLNANQLYKLGKPLPQGDHLVMLQQVGPNNWPSWQLVSQDQLKVLRH